jgi:hypothetical protein
MPHLAVVLLSVAAAALAAQHPADHHNQHHNQVDQRGDRAMGFDHTRTTHRFRLRADGGVIEVFAKDPQDVESRDKIRRHLAHVARRFAAGDFALPVYIHGQDPPGMPALVRLKDEIKYEFKETERGGQVRVVTGNAEALAAVHEFLRFQIRDHRTGDSPEVEKE